MPRFIGDLPENTTVVSTARIEARIGYDCERFHAGGAPRASLVSFILSQDVLRRLLVMRGACKIL